MTLWHLKPIFNIHLNQILGNKIWKKLYNREYLVLGMVPPKDAKFCFSMIFYLQFYKNVLR